MKILVIGDLHGRKPKIPKKKDFDCMVLVGDICDDRDIAPAYRAYFRAIKDRDIDYDDFVLDFLGGLKRYEYFQKLSLERGNNILKFLDSFGKPMFMVAGNWDQSRDRFSNDGSRYSYLRNVHNFYLGGKINPKLIKGIKNVRNCMFKTHKFEGINFIGYGLCSGPEKFRNLSDLSFTQRSGLKKSYAKIFEKLRRNHSKRKNKRFPTFFITHNMPYNTKLDIEKDKKSYAYGKHLGSNIARDFCTKYQPVICVGGHIHEGKGKDKIGKTLVINTGFGPKSTVLIDFDEKKGKVRKVEWVK